MLLSAQSVIEALSLAFDSFCDGASEALFSMKKELRKGEECW